MKKIMFDDKFQLTKDVLEGRKTMTRRAVSARIHKKAGLYRQEYFDETLDALFVEDSLLTFSPFKPDEVVAVSQPYKDVIYTGGLPHPLVAKPGWTNKMFVLPGLMPHCIRITNVRVERLQDISDEDCLREGIVKVQWMYGCEGLCERGDQLYFGSPRSAFAALIDKISGKGTWNRNPYAFAYTFKLED